MTSVQGGAHFNASGTFQCAAGEVVRTVFGIVDASGTPASLADRALVWRFIDRAGVTIGSPIDGVVAPDGYTVGFTISGAVTEALRGQIGLSYEIAMKLKLGRTTLFTAAASVLSVGSLLTGSDGDPSVDNLIVTAGAATLIVSAQGAPGSINADALAVFYGTVTAAALARSDQTLAPVIAAGDARTIAAAGLANSAAANAAAKTLEAKAVVDQGNANGVLRNYRDPTLAIVARIGSAAWPAVTNDPAAPGLRAYTAISDGSSLRTTTFGAVFTFTRAGTAQARNAAGAIVTAAANVMRLDYRYNLATSAWMLAGILLQTQRTNTFLQSQDWTVVANGWANTGAGNSTATAIIEDAANSQHFKAAAGTNTQSFTAGVMQVLSFRASERPGSAKRLALAFLTGTVLAANGSAVFDLATGTAYVNGGGGTTEAGCIPDGPGSWICWWRFTPTGTATNAVRIGLSTTTTATTSSYQGDGTSGLNITDVQLEVGSTPSARIPTTTAQATRVADVLVQALGIEFNPAAGTEFVSARWAVVPIAANTARLVQIDDGTEANRITIRLGGGAIIAEIVVGGTVIASVTGPTIAKDTDYLVKTAWQMGQLSLTVGAVTYTDAAPANLPAGLTTRRIGCDSAGGGQPNAWIRTYVDHPTDHTRDASAYARALTSAERQVYA